MFLSHRCFSFSLSCLPPFSLKGRKKKYIERKKVEERKKEICKWLKYQNCYKYYNEVTTQEKLERSDKLTQTDLSEDISLCRGSCQCRSSEVKISLFSLKNSKACRVLEYFSHNCTILFNPLNVSTHSCRSLFFQHCEYGCYNYPFTYFPF